MTFILRSIKTGKFFAGYPGEGFGKSLGNKPTWTNNLLEAKVFTSVRVFRRCKRRLECQFQFVEVLSRSFDILPKMKTEDWSFNANQSKTRSK